MSLYYLSQAHNFLQLSEYQEEYCLGTGVPYYYLGSFNTNYNISEMLKFSETFFLKLKNWEILNLEEYFIFQNENFKIN
jgi:hypothetical protein